MSGRHTGDRCGVRWTLTAAGRDLLADADLRLERHLAAGRAVVVKHGRHRTVYRIAAPGGEVSTGSTAGSTARGRGGGTFFRGPKAKLEFDRARRSAARGVETIEPLAWARFRGRWPRGSFLITRASTGPSRWTSLSSTTRRTRGPPPSHAALAEYVAKLHAAGVTHPDLHPGNLLVRPDAGDRPSST